MANFVSTSRRDAGNILCQPLPFLSSLYDKCRDRPNTVMNSTPDSQTVSYGGRRTVAPPRRQGRQRSAFFPLLPPFPSPPCLPPPSAAAAAAVMVSLTSVSPSLYVSTQHSDVRWHHSSARMSGSTTRNDSAPLSPDSPSHQAVTAARRFSAVTEETGSVSGRAMTQLGGRGIENFHFINCDFRFFVLFFLPLRRSQQSRRSHLGKPVLLCTPRRATSKVVCVAASFTAHVYSMGHLIHSPSALSHRARKECSPRL